MAIIMDKDLY